MAKRKIGVVGLGNMGRGIAENLLKAGFPVVAWDVVPAARAAFEGRTGLSLLPPGEMAAAAGVIFYVVPASPQIEATFSGKDGVLARARKGLVVYDLTTSDPVRTKRLAKRAAAKGIAYLDAGMSGGAMGAAAGKLTLMIGGDEAVFKRTLPILKTIADADRIFHLGPSGAGHTMKLVHNMVVHTNFVAACEAGRLAEKAGIPLDRAVAVMNGGNARSFITEVRFPRHILTDKWDGNSRVANLHKDLGMAVDLAGKLKVDAAMGRETLAFLQAAVDMGMADTDFTRLYAAFDKVRKREKKA